MPGKCINPTDPFLGDASKEETTKTKEEAPCNMKKRRKKGRPRKKRSNHNKDSITNYFKKIKPKKGKET